MHKRMCVNDTYIPPDISMYIFLTFIFKSPLKKILNQFYTYITLKISCEIESVKVDCIFIGSLFKIDRG